MPNQFNEECVGDTKESEILEMCLNNIQVKPDTENEAQLNNLLHPFSANELETRVKDENYCDGDGHHGPLVNMVKSELVEFRKSDEDNGNDFSQNDTITVTFEKTPKIEEFIGSEVDPDPNYSTNIYNNDNSDEDVDADPELDPFADVDCDQSFSQQPPSHNLNDSVAQSVQSSNEAGANQRRSAKTILPTAKTTSKNNAEHKALIFTLQCQLCLKTQSSKQNLKHHVKICGDVHKGRGRRFCAPCNQMFYNPDSCKRHTLQIHGIKSVGFRSLKCDICPRSFNLKESLLAHSAFHHKNNAVNTDASASHLTGHQKSHQGERPFKCPLPNCEKTFKLTSHLKTHLQRSHPEDKSFNCPEAAGVKPRRGSKVDQGMIHCPEPNCETRFKHKDSLKKHHAIVHTTRKDSVLFSCLEPNCDRKFRCEKYVRDHLRTHTRPYKCTEEPGCSAAFSDRKYLISHIKSKHKRK